jgi:hypothetical protein
MEYKKTTLEMVAKRCDKFSLEFVKPLNFEQNLILISPIFLFFSSKLQGDPKKTRTPKNAN